jgi:hypothetical protein
VCFLPQLCLIASSCNSNTLKSSVFSILNVVFYSTFFRARHGLTLIAARPVLVKTGNGFITVEGVDDQTDVRVYTIDGKQVGAAVSHYNTATIATSIETGSIAIVKVGDKSVKVLMK